MNNKIRFIQTRTAPAPLMQIYYGRLKLKTSSYSLILLPRRDWRGNFICNTERSLYQVLLGPLNTPITSHFPIHSDQSAERSSLLREIWQRIILFTWRPLSLRMPRGRRRRSRRTRRISSPIMSHPLLLSSITHHFRPIIIYCISCMWLSIPLPLFCSPFLFYLVSTTILSIASKAAAFLGLTRGTESHYNKSYYLPRPNDGQ